MKVEGAAATACRDAIAKEGGSLPTREALATAALTPDELALFAEVGRVRRVYAGEVLFRRGELGTAMYVVVRGAIDLDFGDDLIVKRLGPAEFFGELGLLVGDHARSAEASVPVDGEVLELHHEEFQRLVEREPGMICYFLRRAIMRVVINEQGLVRRLRRRNRELEAALDHLRATAHQLQQTEVLIRTDELTGLANRRGLTRHLAERRHNGAMSGLGLLLVACDGFKQIRDDHGHGAGDRVLQSVANILRSVSGAGDMACRLEGAEFALLVKATTREEVTRIAQFVLSSAEGLQRMGPVPPLVCSLSIGACLVEPEGDFRDWHATADAALLRARQGGGNRMEWQDAPVRPA